MKATRQRLVSFEGPAVAIPRDNIDTDQIIPARFLKTTSRAGLARHLFADWRAAPDGTLKPDFVLNTEAGARARVLVAGWNFGCGSSREHAPWALSDFGFRAVFAASFADIFRQNALKNGLLPVELPAETHAALLARTSAEPGVALGVDLARQLAMLPGLGEVPFAVDPFARECLLAGVDEIGWVLARSDAIARFEAADAPAAPAA